MQLFDSISLDGTHTHKHNIVEIDEKKKKMKKTY